MQQAQQIINSQSDMSLGIKRSAWLLFQHELGKTNPATSKPFTVRRALSNTLKWMRQQKARQDAALQQLTPTQRTIIRLVVEEGLTQKEVALRLGRELVTIKKHVAEIRSRMGVSSLYQVVAVAVERGWVNTPKLDN
jgi:DNA-binding NarL/FixJ family response regulator